MAACVGTVGRWEGSEPCPAGRMDTWWPWSRVQIHCSATEEGGGCTQTHDACRRGCWWGELRNGEPWGNLQCRLPNGAGLGGPAGHKGWRRTAPNPQRLSCAHTGWPRSRASRGPAWALSPTWATDTSPSGAGTCWGAHLGTASVLPRAVHHTDRISQDGSHVVIPIWCDSLLWCMMQWFLVHSEGSV